MFSLVTDTSANLDCRLLEQLHITVIPFSFFVNGEEYSCTDTSEFDGPRFYEAMKSGVRVTTSQVPPQRFADYVEPLLQKGEDVLFVGMSSGISGSFQSASLAAEQLRESYPERQLCLVDSLGASLGEGLLVLKANEYREQGLSAAETAEKLEALRLSMCQVFTVDDLEYLRRSGRLNGIGALVGTVLHIKPILKGNREGKIVSMSKVRGRKASIRTLAAQYEETVREPERQTVGIAHGNCPEDAELLARLLREKKAPRSILTVCYEPVTGSHVGPGTLALFFLGDEGFRED